MMFQGKKTIVIGITGGIAAFKALSLVKILKEKSYDVIVIMTKSATQMVNPAEFEKASGNKIYTQLFEDDFNYRTILKKREVDHIQIADKADLFVIIPATANIIAKVAHGIADDFLTTSLLATKAPILLCPSMNVHMWENPVVQENIQKVKLLGIQIIDPDSGMLACGYEGKARLADIRRIESEIEFLLDKTSRLSGKKVIVTAGGTIEPIDDIRFIANRSSGKMGAAIAEACFQRGAEVLFLCSNHAVLPRFPIKVKTFDTADQLVSLLKRYAPTYDVCFHAAAISDFSVKRKQEGKISSAERVSLDLVPREKVMRKIKKFNPKMQLIAFKAEWKIATQELIRVAKGKINEFQLEAIIANDVSKKGQGFESDMNEVVIVSKNGNLKKINLDTKRKIAEEIVDYLL